MRRLLADAIARSPPFRLEAFDRVPGIGPPQGFRDWFEKILRESDFAIPLSEIRCADRYAKGALAAEPSEV